jgi:hypothetical protein
MEDQLVLEGTNGNSQRTAAEQETTYENVFVFWVEVEKNHHQRVGKVTEICHEIVPAL